MGSTVVDDVAAAALEHGTHVANMINTLIIAPPLTITEDGVDEAVGAIDIALDISDEAMTTHPGPVVTHLSDTSAPHPVLQRNELEPRRPSTTMNGTLRGALDLDETDLGILRRVEKDFDVSLETLANELGISKSAVHYRLKKLRENGIIEGITADVNPLAFGLEMVAITDISVTHESGYSEDIGEQLQELQGVEQVYYTMGDVGFVAISRVQSRDQLNDHIERIVAIAGVNETSSKFVLQEFHGADRVTANLTDEARDLVLNGTN